MTFLLCYTCVCHMTCIRKALSFKMLQLHVVGPRIAFLFTLRKCTQYTRVQVTYKVSLLLGQVVVFLAVPEVLEATPTDAPNGRSGGTIPVEVDD